MEFLQKEYLFTCIIGTKINPSTNDTKNLKFYPNALEVISYI